MEIIDLDSEDKEEISYIQNEEEIDDSYNEMFLEYEASQGWCWYFW